MAILSQSWILLVSVGAVFFACQQAEPNQAAAKDLPKAKAEAVQVYTPQVELRLPALGWNIRDASAVAVSPDGKQVAVSEHRSLHVLDAATLAQVRSYELGDKEGNLAMNREYEIRRMKWSPDGRVIATESDNGAVRLWDLASGKHGLVTQYRNRVNAMVFSPSGRFFATSGSMISSKALKVVEVHKRRHEGEYGLVLEKSYHQFAFSTDESEIWVKTDQGVQAWRLVVDAKPSHVEIIDKKLNFEFVADGRTLLVEAENKVGIHKIGAGRHGFLEGLSRFPYQYRFSPSAKHLVGEEGGKLVVWSLSSGKRVRELPVNGVLDLATSDDASVAAIMRSDGFAVYDLVKKHERKPLHRHEGSVAAIALSPDDKWLATSCHDGFLRLWNVADGKLLWQAATRGGAQMTQLVFSPKGKKIAGVDKSRQAHIFDARDGKQQTIGAPFSVNRVSFPAKGKLRMIQFGSSDEIRVIQGKSDQKILVKDFDPTWLRLTADGTHLIGADENQVRLFNATTGLLRSSFLINSVAGTASADGTLVALMDSDTEEVVLWSSEGKELYRLKPGDEPAEVIALSTDGKLLVIDSNFGESIKVMDARSGKELHNFKPNTKWMPTGALVSHSGSFIVISAHSDVIVLRPLQN